MSLITELFDRMDLWRQLPNYQLERRADLFFSLYLPEALETKLGFPVRSELVPEFPVRIGTVCPNKPINKSFKIDYLALSSESDKAIFVELKTEERSRRIKQDKYLAAARDIGLTRLLKGLLDIFRVTNAKAKYYCLLEQLDHLGLIQVPAKLREIMTRSNLQGANEASHEVRVTCRTKQCLIVYVQPNGHGPNIISFAEFRTIVQNNNDALSARFAESLNEWAVIQAGKKASNN
ncbi:MAG: hypothetical protein JSV03_08035 [Planctomycetota bacterium]|nr:MAG: hypothetical protein JSV03_08035 [Planctomycetota bacterium]